MLRFTISAASTKTLYTNGVKEYNIEITEDDPTAAYIAVKFNVVSSPPRDYMALKGTFVRGVDDGEGEYLDNGESVVNIDTAPSNRFGHSAPLEIKVGGTHCLALKSSGKINLVIELEAGVGVGRNVPTPETGFLSSSDGGYLSLLINNVQCIMNNTHSIVVEMKPLPE